jgi:hypothetical protein
MEDPQARFRRSSNMFQEVKRPARLQDSPARNKKQIVCISVNYIATAIKTILVFVVQRNHRCTVVRKPWGSLEFWANSFKMGTWDVTRPQMSIFVAVLTKGSVQSCNV